MNKDEELKIIREIISLAEEAHNRIIENFKNCFVGKSKEEIKQLLIDEDDSVLNFLCEKIGLESEIYELCWAAKEILKERNF
ncbi:MAG: hypothetical protein SFY56_10010 [Bacteroidota bacterium]|nr:hypothetical protein [Bacteroidota bacterium]